jgi:hypothetical protein
MFVCVAISHAPLKNCARVEHTRVYPAASLGEYKKTQKGQIAVHARRAALEVHVGNIFMCV